MHLEGWFDFFSPDDIRVKGTRVGIEVILYDYIHRAKPPEEIAEDHPSVTLEQVFATILYYLHNKEAIAHYLADHLEYSRKAREQYEKNPAPVVLRLRKLKAEREARRLAEEASLPTR